MLNHITKLSLSVAVLGHMPSSGAAKLPGQNIIFILADDLGIGDLGCYGQKVIKTPSIDKLAKSGLIFTQYYSGTTVSAPSRCVLF